MFSHVFHRQRGDKVTGTPPFSAAASTVKGSPYYAGIKQHLFRGAYGRALLALTLCAITAIVWTVFLLPASKDTKEPYALEVIWHRVATFPNGRYKPVYRQYDIHHSGNSRLLSPNASVVFSPFKDLCEWVTGTHTLSMHATAEMPAAAYATDAATRAFLESALDRFNHLPADGGAAGRRWSAATGLPLASQRTGEVRVRFLTVTNRVDATTHLATVAAAMAGVRLEVVGMGWDNYNFFKRTSLLVSYAEHEKLTDSDVIVATDADAVMSGEDAELFLSAFIASTAASEEEHMTYRVRDIRMGKRQTPVVFSGEWSCWMVQAFSYDDCPRGYKSVYDLREKWVQSSNESLQRNFNNANPFKYLNAGVMVARVWALRQLGTIQHRFAVEAKTRIKERGKDWWCDQTAFGGMYLDLLRWELESHAWDGAPVAVPEEKMKNSVFHPHGVPAGRLGPYDLPPGLIGIDQSTRLSLTIEPDMSGKKLFGLNEVIVNSVSEPEPILLAALPSVMPGETSVVGVVRSSHRLTISPRNNVDCVGVDEPPPECAYRDAVWGIPEGTKAVAPLLWHFAGSGKELRFAHYRAVFPWYTPTLVNTEALQRLVHVFANLPPTRAFSIDPETDNDAYLGDARVLPHNAVDDMPVAHVCRASVLKPS